VNPAAAGYNSWVEGAREAWFASGFRTPSFVFSAIESRRYWYHRTVKGESLYDISQE
jgi:hypothetical protein